MSSIEIIDRTPLDADPQRNVPAGESAILVCTDLVIHPETVALFGRGASIVSLETPDSTRRYSVICRGKVTIDTVVWVVKALEGDRMQAAFRDLMRGV